MFLTNSINRVFDPPAFSSPTVPQIVTSAIDGSQFKTVPVTTSDGFLTLSYSETAGLDIIRTPEYTALDVGVATPQIIPQLYGVVGITTSAQMTQDGQVSFAPFVAGVSGQSRLGAELKIFYEFWESWVETHTAHILLPDGMEVIHNGIGFNSLLVLNPSSCITMRCVKASATDQNTKFVVCDSFGASVGLV